jgi:hypothetical protein
MNIVATPLLFPLLRLKGAWEGAGYLNCLDDGEIWCRFMIKKSQNFIVNVNSGACELDSGQPIVLLHSDSARYLLQFFHAVFISSNFSLFFFF